MESIISQLELRGWDLKALTKEQQNHISETSLDNYRFDYKIIAENMMQLEDEVFWFYEILKGGDEDK